MQDFSQKFHNAFSSQASGIKTFRFISFNRFCCIAFLKKKDGCEIE